MKLATYNDGSRDGQLVVVSRDLTNAHYASGIATRLQQVLDDWNFMAPQLEELSQALWRGKARHSFAFEPARCMAPLPRAYQWLEGSAFINHVERMRKASHAEVPPSFYTDPLMVQGDSNDLLGPCDDVVVASEDFGVDFEAEVAIVTGDVARGTDAEAALESVRLVMLANGVSLRHLIPDELAKGFGFVQSKPATSFGSVALTPDECGDAWRGGRLHLDVESTWNGRRVGLCHAGHDMTFHFGQLIAHAAKTRRLRAGSIIGSGTVSNQEAARGYSCIAEKRAVENVESGAPVTPFMSYGDTIRIEVKDGDGQSLFGAIDQKIVPPLT